MARTARIKTQSFSADITDSESTRKCFFNFAGLPFCCALQRLDRASMIVMQDRVELVGQARVKVMTHQFRFRPVDHTDGAFEPFITQRRCDIVVVSKSEKEVWNVDFVKKRFVTFPMRRTHILALSRSVP